jgi:protein-S-isoprenylcysteine O-methyltransferase Ste14
MMGTLAYLLVSIALVFAVLIFIGKEEKKLVQVFGKEYEEYLTRVSRIVPIIRPGKRVG